MSYDYEKEAAHVTAVAGAVVKTLVLTVLGIGVFYGLMCGGLYALIYLLFD